jgi:predicted Zn finger-like uncharacterized protein
MYTFCPNCSALYRLTVNHLGKAAGQARCGECRQVYSAIDYLFDDLEVAREVLALQREPGARKQPVANEVAVSAGPAAASGAQAATIPAHPARPLPDSWQQQSISLSDIGSGVAIGFLLLVLGLQWVFFNRAELAANESWRPMLERGCSIVNCTMPLRTDLSRIDIISRDVRKHPTIKEVLLVNVAFKNTAEFTQPYPVLEVSFTDQSGEAIAVRRFNPAEYLGESTDRVAGMAAGSPVEVVLEIVDPGDKVVSFQFAFL